MVTLRESFSARSALGTGANLLLCTCSAYCFALATRPKVNLSRDDERFTWYGCEFIALHLLCMPRDCFALALHAKGLLCTCSAYCFTLALQPKVNLRKLKLSFALIAWLIAT